MIILSDSYIDRLIVENLRYGKKRNENGKNYQDIVTLWGELFQNGNHGLLLPDQDELGAVGITYDWSNKNKI